MPRTISPCKDCRKRVVGCHSVCERYKRFQRINEQEREAIRHTSGYIIPKGSWTGDAGLLRRRPGQ